VRFLNRVNGTSESSESVPTEAVVEEHELPEASQPEPAVAPKKTSRKKKEAA
jgi:hypothetical protein